MINYKYFDLLLKNSIPKQIMIEFDGITLTNDDLYNQEMTLEESLCSEEELRFGSCEVSVLKFKISNIFLPMVGKWLDVKMVVDGNSDTPFPIGKYKVDSDKIASDRKYREIIAYDAMYDIINSSVINWYNTILPDKDSKVIMKQFRSSFIKHFGLEEEDVTLVNDNMIIEKTIQVEEGIESDTETEQVSILKESALSGLDVITAICEINGCFGHIGRDGKFKYIYLQQDIGGLYPSDNLFPDHAPEHLAQSKTGHLYPQDPNSYRIDGSKYIKCDWENFFTKRITKLQIRNSENEIGKIWPEEDMSSEDNCYIIEDNFLVYGKSDQQLREIARNIFEKITDIVYMPFSGDMIGNPCLEVGDPIRIPTRYEIVESYVLQRTLKGIQALRDDIRANGVEKYGDKVNGVQSSIIQLKGKTNTLVRNVNETRSELTSFERDTAGNFTDVRSSIVQTAENITSTVSAATSKYDTKNYEVGLFGYEDGEEIKYEASENNGKYYLNQGNGNLYLSNGASWELVEQLKLITENLSSRIAQTVKSIKLEVKNGEKTAGISITLENEDGFESELKGIIEMSGMVVFSDLSNEGKTTINGKNITTGEINCDLLNGGEINGQKIVGGEVNGATVKAKEGLYLQYTNTNTRPPISGEYVFAETGYDSGENGGVVNDAFLNIVSPHGTVMICGYMFLKDFDNPLGFKLVNTAYFPGGFITDNAMINHLQETRRKNVYRTDADSDGNILAVVNANVKVFGAFVCVYGTYEVNSQTSGAAKFFSLGDSGDDYVPKWAAVRTLSSESGKMFMFTLDTSGRFIASNKSGTNVTQSITMTFRFDFIRT